MEKYSKDHYFAAREQDDDWWLRHKFPLDQTELCYKIQKVCEIEFNFIISSDDACNIWRNWNNRKDKKVKKSTFFNNFLNILNYDTYVGCYGNEYAEYIKAIKYYMDKYHDVKEIA